MAFFHAPCEKPECDSAWGPDERPVVASSSEAEQQLWCETAKSVLAACQQGATLYSACTLIATTQLHQVLKGCALTR